MSSAAHPVSSSADPVPVGAQPSHPLPDVTKPHETAAPPQAADPAAAVGDKKPKQAQGGQKKEKKDKKAGGAASAGPLEVKPPPEFFAERIKIFDEHMEKYKQFVAGTSPPSIASPHDDILQEV
jgi:threonyl-tRNA synthetase